MNRRTLLRLSATAFAGGVGASAVSGTAAADEADPRPDPQAGTLPDDDVPTVQVDPITGPFQNHEAPPGVWIKHNVGWNGPTCETLFAVIENTEEIIHIDGERIQNPRQYWGECVVADHDPGFDIQWNYFTPPKPPGTYQFSREVVFTDDVGGIPAGTVIGPFENPYEVHTGADTDRGPESGTLSAVQTTPGEVRPI